MAGGEEEERDRDADDDEDRDGDDEDEGFRESRKKEAVPPGNLTVNMFNVLRENECE